MKRLPILLGLALTLTACHSRSYKLNGTVQGYADGDTIIVADMSMQPTDTLIVKGGAFSLKGKTDSVELAVVYPQKNPDDAVLVFLEPGTIQLTLSGESLTSRVSGTKANDGLQALTDKTNEIEVRLEQLGQAFNDSTLTDDRRMAITQEYVQIQNDLPRIFTEAAEENIDNEFGYFVVTNLAPNMELEQVQALIDKMPAAFRERQAVKELETMISQANGTDEEEQLEDFSLPTPDGTEMSILDEVEKHQLTILDFWASWCQPCMREMPNMINLYEQYHDKGLGIIGISLDEDQDQWTKAIKTLGIAWPQVSDLKGWHSFAAEMFQVQSIPHMIVVDKSGTILKRGLRGEALAAFISEQLDDVSDPTD